MPRILRFFFAQPSDLGIEGLSSKEIILLMQPDGENESVHDDLENAPSISPYAKRFAELIESRPSKKSSRNNGGKRVRYRS